jgi:hypothetical protein
LRTRPLAVVFLFLVGVISNSHEVLHLGLALRELL